MKDIENSVHAHEEDKVGSNVLHIAHFINHHELGQYRECL